MQCQYKDALGVPGEGIHSYRIFNLAIVDIVLTLLAAWVISYSFNINFFHVAVAMFLLGIFLHRVFCVRTTVDKLLFRSTDASL